MFEARASTFGYASIHLDAKAKDRRECDAKFKCTLVPLIVHEIFDYSNVLWGMNSLAIDKFDLAQEVPNASDALNALRFPYPREL